MQTFLTASGPRAMLLAGAISAVLPLSGFAQTYDAVAQFNTSGVQIIGAVWTYGTETSLNSGFSLLPSYQSNYPCGVLPSGEASTCAPTTQQFSDYYLAIPFYGPAIAKNTSATPATMTFTVAGPSLIWPGSSLLVIPACGSQVAPPLSIVRWTAPAAGTYNIAGMFQNDQEANTPVYVSINGITIFANTSALNGAEPVESTVGFSGGALSNVSLAAGDTVDFIVASAGYNSGNCAVGLSATISVQSTQGATQDFTERAAFAAATTNPTTIGFNGILPPGVLYESFNPLIVSGVSFSTPVPGVSVDVAIGSYYSPNNYTNDFTTNSVIASTSQSSPNNELIISLPNPTFALGLDFGGLGFNGVGTAAITLSNGYVFTQPVLPTVGQTTFVGFVSTDPITGLTLVTTNDDWVLEDLVLASASLGLSCVPALSPTGQGFGSQGGLGSFTVTIGSTCIWSLNPSASWITILPSGSQGSGQVTYAVAANTGGARTGTISVAGQSFNISQSGFSCTYTINPASASVYDSGGTAHTTVNTAAGCPWTATSNASWITVTSGQAGTGNGTVVIAAAPNTGGPRSGTVTIAGQTYTVTEGAGACGAVDVSTEVHVSAGQFIPFSVGFGSSLFTQTVSVTNTSSSVIQGPVYLVTIGMPTHQFPTDPSFANSGLATTPPGTTFTTCFTAAGDYLIPLAVGSLGPGQTVNLGALTWIAGPGGLGYSTRVLSGKPSK